MTLAIRVPKGFYDDCEACETETPTIIKTTARHYWLNVETGHSTDNPNELSAWDDIKSRAVCYAESAGFDEYIKRTVCVSARAFLNAMDKKTATVENL